MTEQTVTAEALNDLRQRYLDGKPWTREELKSAIQTMIGQRLIDVQTAAAPKTKKTKAKLVSLDDMLLPSPMQIGVDTGVKTVTEQRMTPPATADAFPTAPITVENAPTPVPTKKVEATSKPIKPPTGFF